VEGGFFSAAKHSLRTLFRQSGIRRGGYRPLFINLAVVLAFGVLIPVVKRFTTFHPVVVFAFSFIPLLYAIPGASDLVSRSTPHRPAIICGRLTGCALYAWIILAAIYGLTILTVNAMHSGDFVHPAWPVLGCAALLGFFIALGSSAATAVLSVLFSPAAARNSMRLFLLVVLVALLLSPRWLPSSWNAAIARQYTERGLTRAAYAASAVLGLASAGLMIALAAGGRSRRTAGGP
jgi:hypothetical protein